VNTSQGWRPSPRIPREQRPCRPPEAPRSCSRGRALISPTHRQLHVRCPGRADVNAFSVLAGWCRALSKTVSRSNSWKTAVERRVAVRHDARRSRQRRRQRRVARGCAVVKAVHGTVAWRWSDRRPRKRWRVRRESRDGCCRLRRACALGDGRDAREHVYW
jgi:hypothetical protein